MGREVSAPRCFDTANFASSSTTVEILIRSAGSSLHNFVTSVHCSLVHALGRAGISPLEESTLTVTFGRFPHERGQLVVVCWTESTTRIASITHIPRE